MDHPASQRAVATCHGRPGHAAATLLLCAAALLLALGPLGGCREDPSGTIDWNRKPLRETKDKLGAIAFSINLPDGLTLTRTGDALTWAPSKAEPGSPRVVLRVEDSALSRLAQAAERATADGAPAIVERQDKIPSGYLIVHHTEDQHAISATVYRKLKSGEILSCVASVSESRASLVATGNWLANICQSLAPNDRR
ncbi:MAG: hypothetical protein AAGC55_19235 [Myxococcota bacterium]